MKYMCLEIIKFAQKKSDETAALLRKIILKLFFCAIEHLFDAID